MTWLRLLICFKAKWYHLRMYTSTGLVTNIFKSIIWQLRTERRMSFQPHTNGSLTSRINYPIACACGLSYCTRIHVLLIINSWKYGYNVKITVAVGFEYGNVSKDPMANYKPYNHESWFWLVGRCHVPSARKLRKLWNNVRKQSNVQINVLNDYLTCLPLQWM